MFSSKITTRYLIGVVVVKSAADRGTGARFWAKVVKGFKSRPTTASKRSGSVLFISASLSCQTVVTIRRGQIHWNKRSRLLLRGYEIFGKYLIEGAAFAGCQVIIRVRFSRREDCCALANLVAGAKGPLLNIRSLAIVIF